MPDLCCSSSHLSYIYNPFATKDCPDITRFLFMAWVIFASTLVQGGSYRPSENLATHILLMDADSPFLVTLTQSEKKYKVANAYQTTLVIHGDERVYACVSPSGIQVFLPDSVVISKQNARGSVMINTSSFKALPSGCQWVGQTPAVLSSPQEDDNTEWQMPIVKEKYFASPSAMKNGAANYFSWQGDLYKDELNINSSWPLAPDSGAEHSGLCLSGSCGFPFDDHKKKYPWFGMPLGSDLSISILPAFFYGFNVAYSGQDEPPQTLNVILVFDDDTGQHRLVFNLDLTTLRSLLGQDSELESVNQLMPWVAEQMSGRTELVSRVFALQDVLDRLFNDESTLSLELLEMREGLRRQLADMLDSSTRDFDYELELHFLNRTVMNSRSLPVSAPGQHGATSHKNGASDKEVDPDRSERRDRIKRTHPSKKEAPVTKKSRKEPPSEDQLQCPLCQEKNPLPGKLFCQQCQEKVLSLPSVGSLFEFEEGEIIEYELLIYRLIQVIQTSEPEENFKEKVQLLRFAFSEWQKDDPVKAKEQEKQVYNILAMQVLLWVEKGQEHANGPYMTLWLNNYVPDKPLLARKLHKLTLQGRPYEARSGDHQCPATLLYHSQGPFIQHSGKFSRQCGNESEPIRCRHLAYGYVSGAFGRSPEKFQAVETEERLLDTSGIPDEKTLTKNFYDHLPGHAVYFNLQTLPDALYFLAQEIEDHQRVNYLFCSINHAMGLSLVKTEGQGIKLYCYDPNDTGRHKKIIVHDAVELKKLTIDDLVADSHRYFPQGLESGCLLSIEVKKKQEDCRVKCFGPQDVETVYLMAEYGHYGATDLDGKPMRLADTKQNAQLIGKLTDGAPALFMAAQDGHTETVRALAELILSSSLDNETKNELLAGKSADGTSALLMAAQYGHTETVRVLAEMILSSSLDNESKNELLAGKRADGTSALLMAAQKGHTETVRVLAELILSSSLDNETKNELLAGKSADGTSALLMAAQYGHTETVRVLAEMILSSSLDNESKNELLAGKRADGTPALFMAAQDGHTGTVRVLAEMILSSSLDNETKNELLAGQSADGTPALLMAAQDGHTGTVRVLAEMILSSSLDNESKNELLAGKRANGTSALFMAAKNGHTDTVRVLAEMILSSSLDNESKNELLAGKSSGWHACIIYGSPRWAH